MTAPAVVEKVEAPVVPVVPVVTDDAAAKAAADKATADKAAADKVAADAIAAADAKVIADAKAAQETKDANRTAIKAALKLPDGSTLDPALTERTAAIASELGLNPDTAPKVLEHLVKEATTHAEARVAALLKSNEPGGEAFKALHEQYAKDLLAHPQFGAGKPEQFEANRGLVTRVVASFAAGAGLTAEELKAVEASGFLNNPLGARILLAVGKAMKEDQLVAPGSGAAPLSRDQRLERLFPSTKKKD